MNICREPFLQGMDDHHWEIIVHDWDLYTYLPEGRGSVPMIRSVFQQFDQKCTQVKAGVEGSELRNCFFFPGFHKYSLHCWPFYTVAFYLWIQESWNCIHYCTSLSKFANKCVISARVSYCIKQREESCGALLAVRSVMLYETTALTRNKYVMLARIPPTLPLPQTHLSAQPQTPAYHRGRLQQLGPPSAHVKQAPNYLLPTFFPSRPITTFFPREAGPTWSRSLGLHSKNIQPSYAQAHQDKISKDTHIKKTK